ncbi:MAG: NAD(P)H-dependent oxidoreductase [Flavobacteriaceae bacterium]|nr:NAD(P)H-dependent oxidoreductase [Flavobacteriaceae bacterium]
MASNIIEQLEWRYATKKFDESKKLSEEKLSILKKAFNLTATSYGLQPLKLVIVSNPEKIKELVPMSYNQGQVGNASQILVICTETNIDEKYIRNYFDLVEKTRNTSREILSSFEEFLISDFGNKTQDEIDVWAAKQAYLAIGNLLTVCAVEEIDACPIEGFLPSKYDEHLQLTEKGLKSVLVLAVGYRAEDDMFSKMKKVRKAIEEMVIEIK